VVPGADRAARFGVKQADEDGESQEGHGGVVLSRMRRWGVRGRLPRFALDKPRFACTGGYVKGEVRAHAG
jgi:hypothetical protein